MSVVFWYLWYVVLFSILFWLDAWCACVIVERQFYQMTRFRLLLWLRATYLLVPWSSFIEYSFCLEHAVYFTVLGSLEANAPVAAKPSQNELHFVPWTSFILGRN